MEDERQRLEEEKQRLLQEKQQLVKEGLEASHPRWQVLLKDKDVLLEEVKAYNMARQQQGAAGSSGQAGAGAGAGASRVDASMVVVRTKAAARYLGFALARDNTPRAVTVLTPDQVITYAHGEHDSWQEGDVVKVFVNDPRGERPVQVEAVVVGKYPKVDVIILKVQGRWLEAPALDTHIPQGEPYVMLGYSSTAVVSPRGPGERPRPEDYTSVTHGSISSSTPDKHGRIRGDTPSSPGDSGGGVFSLQTGKLIAMNIGREEIPSSQGGEQSGNKALLVPVAAILALTGV